MSEHIILDPSILIKYREVTFNHKPKNALKNINDALDFVNQRGFIFFWPNKEVVFPNLWGAVAGKRAVADNHDDPAHITWRWKDNMLGKNCWYYAKIIRIRSTIISLNLLPYFYALSPNFGNPEEDYLVSYHDGELSNDEKMIYEAILKKGPLDTITLRTAANLTSNINSSRFTRAINLLQKDFRIMPVEISDKGAWHYSFVYDATHRNFSHLPEIARTISEKDAAREIMRSYFKSLGGSTYAQIKRFFQWSESMIRNSLKDLKNKNEIRGNGYFEDSSEEWYTIGSLIN